MEDLLPAELMIDILSRLPVKTIIHCKCLCKKWQNLLLESSFVDLHLSRSPTGLLICHGRYMYSKDSNDSAFSLKWYVRRDPGISGWVEIEDNDDYHHLHHDPLMSLRLNLAPILHKSVIKLMASVNGLICLWKNHFRNPDNTYICNPVTREYMILYRQNYYNKGKGAIIYGFGMSSMTGEYKVIQTFQNLSQPSVSEAEVYTLGTGQWRSLGHVPYKLYVSYDGSFLNDHCHWIVHDKEEKICTFDLDKETFQLFPSPPAIQGSEYHCESLAIIKGCLCKMDSYDFEFTIWVMKEYGIKESWHKEVIINQAFSPELGWPIEDPLYVIEGLKDGSFLMLHYGNLWESYPNNKTIEEIGFIELMTFRGALPYCPSFVKLQDFELERVHMF